MTNKGYLLSAITIILFLATMLIIVLVPWGQRLSCSSPVFTGHYTDDPYDIMVGIVATLGGLPQKDTELQLEPTLVDSASVQPVETWDITAIRVEQTTSSSLLDDDPIYGLTVDLSVVYKDGTTGLLQWEWWRYGIVRCPLVINYGDGPLGTLRILQLQKTP